MLLMIAAYASTAQITQTIRGKVVDQVLQTALPGATVILAESNQQTVSDSTGNFSFHNIPVGTWTLQASYVGYQDAFAANIMVTSGKEQVITISMLPSLTDDNNVIVKGNSKKNKPLNSASVVSARAFTVEETQRYAAAVNDPLRMATAFAGVIGADDGNNNIVIRGNAPNGLLWRMEGIEIPNPNHFAASGSSGGGISILSSQLLANSDFVTGAFAAEYGNAQSGVFDLKLRKGNDQQREYTLQAGVLGINAAAEGPIKKGSQASYLVNYRYSTLSMLDKIGVNVGDATTDFQDYAYNFYLPTKKAGTFTLFGFGGISQQKSHAIEDSSLWEGDGDRYNWGGKQVTLLSAATHRINIGHQTSVYSAAAWSNTSLRQYESYIDDDLHLNDVYEEDNGTKRFTLSSTINHRFNARQYAKAGVIYNRMAYGYLQKEKEYLEAPYNTTLDQDGNTESIQAFAQWHAGITEKLSTNFGAHVLTLMLNNRTAIEPRASVQYAFSPATSISFGYGMHHRVHPLGVYFAETNNGGAKQQPNIDLDFTRANHYVLSWQQQLAKNLRLRTELYYQQLSNVPVSTDPTKTFSILNHEYGFVSEALVNQGKGRNYGMELSLERYLNNNFYLLWSNSFYQSKYTALDGIERNTRFNGNYASTLTSGKEWVKKGGRRSYGANIKLLYTGGFRQTPVDLEASQQEGHAIYDEQNAYTIQLPDYFRADLRLSITWNRPHHSSILSLDLQNASNRQNVFGHYYDNSKAAMTTVYGSGIIPILNYKIEL